MVSFLRWRYRFEAAIGLGAENVPLLRLQPPKVKMGQHESTRSLCEACIGAIFWPQVMFGITPKNRRMPRIWEYRSSVPQFWNIVT